MTSNPEWVARIECQLDDDPRLLEGATAIVAHVALRAGISESAADEFADAAAKGCKVLFQTCRELGISRPAIRLGAAEFSDHVEIRIAMMPEGVGQDQVPSRPGGPADCVEKIRKALSTAPLDSATVDLRDGSPSVTLVKNCGAPKRRFAS